jgi:hypothetical protein
VNDLDKDHTKALGEKCAKIYLNAKGEEEQDRGIHIKERLTALTAVIFVLKKVAEFIGSITGDIDNETEFDIGPETLDVLRTIMTDAGCDYKACDFVGLCIERQSDVLCYNRQFEMFVNTMNANLELPMPSRFTICQIEAPLRDEFQTTILKKVIGDLAMGPDNEDSLRELLDALVYSNCIISQDMKDNYIKDVHALCAHEEHDDEVIYTALVSIKTALHPFCHPFMKVILLLPCSRFCQVFACWYNFKLFF